MSLVLCTGTLLTVDEAAQWVLHAAQLPQEVSDAFVNNMVTGYDFPELAARQVRPGGMEEGRKGGGVGGSRRGGAVGAGGDDGERDGMVTVGPTKENTCCIISHAHGWGSNSQQ